MTNPKKSDLVCLSSNRDGSKGATYGKVVPLCYLNGSQSVIYKNQKYTMPLVKKNNNIIKYLLYIYLPKFFDLSVKGKLYVLFHELYHINPNFDGDIRNMGNFKRVHGYSIKYFNSFFIKELEDFEKYIKLTSYQNFLEMDHNFFKNNYLSIKGFKVKIPKPTIINQKL